MDYYRKDNSDINKFIIDNINNINSEIESLDKRVSTLCKKMYLFFLLLNIRSSKNTQILIFIIYFRKIYFI